MPLFRKPTSQPPERNAEERERERAERARRRAERDGVAGPVGPAPGEALPPAVEAPPPAAFEAPPPPVEAPPPAAFEALPPPVEAPPPAAFEASPPPVEVPPPPAFEASPPPASYDAPTGAPTPIPAELEPYDPAPPPPTEDDDGHDEPLPPAASPVRREALLERRRHRLARDRGAARSRRGPLTRGRIGALAAVVAIGALAWFAISLYQPFKGAAHGQVVVDIPKGSSAGSIGRILAHDGVVSSGFFFNLRATLSGRRGDLHSGVYRLERDMSYGAAIAALSKPPPAPVTVRVVIPEGKSRREIAVIAAADGLAGDYLAASAHSSLLSPRRYGAPSGTNTLEGFLFPATYEVRAGTGAPALVAEQLTAFRMRFGVAFSRAARARHLTSYQLLTVASMVEREAAVPHDRPLIAAVIYNRLHVGMPLGIDATIRYALNDWSRPLTESDLRIASPFNTRTHRGLPPTPIGNPGAASIAAAAHPAHVSYLYYVAGADGCGEHVFSTTYAQFQRDALAYQTAVQRNGGRVPTCRRAGRG